VEMAKICLKDVPNIEVISRESLLVDVYRELGASAVVRGLRSESDFRYEAEMNAANTLMFPDYSPEELLEILQMNLKEFGHELDNGAKELLLQLFAQKIEKCRYGREPFSNGRYSRNVADALHAQHALNYRNNSSVGATITVQDIDFGNLLSLD